MSDICHCAAHGYFDASECPTCGATGNRILDHSARTQISTFLSGALRHFPDDVGLELDAAGWTELATVVDRASKKYGVDREAIIGIIHTDPKGRFEVDDDRVRAAYGHSVAVDLDAGGTPVPETLYHGTSPDALGAITREGLKPMGRQHVHLSESVEDADAVGSRHAVDPVILVVDAAAMLAADHTITKRGKAVYTTDRVPPEYLAELD
ncbi:MAG: RNA:NAD 2''-phosphotransferase [Halonotius sp. J07HN4]|nr:MAG: RNA:NAD 2''-phosphotransferase [Halonotius sp. J07HN4]